MIDNGVTVQPRVKLAEKVMEPYADAPRAVECLQARLERALAGQGVTVKAQLVPYAPEKDAAGVTEVLSGGNEYLGYEGRVTRLGGAVPEVFDARIVLVRVGRAASQFVFLTSATIPQADVTGMVQSVIDRLQPPVSRWGRGRFVGEDAG